MDTSAFMFWFLILSCVGIGLWILSDPYWHVYKVCVNNRRLHTRGKHIIVIDARQSNMDILPYDQTTALLQRAYSEPYRVNELYIFTQPHIKIDRFDALQLFAVHRTMNVHDQIEDYFRHVERNHNTQLKCVNYTTGVETLSVIE